MNDPDDRRRRDLEERLLDSRVVSDPPPAVLQRAIDAFSLRQRTAGAAAAKPVSITRRLLQAIQVVDEAIGGALQGLLGPAGAAALRGDAGRGMRYVFGAEGIEVELRIVPGDEPDRWVLSGQVLAEIGAGEALLRSGEHGAQASFSEHAEFRFESVPPGTAMLTLRALDWEMALPAVTLPARP